MPGPSTLTRGSITSRTGQMRTDSPGRAMSSDALAMRASRRTAARAASRSTVMRPASYAVHGPNAISVTGNGPTSRRMDRLLRRRGLEGVEERGTRHGRRDRAERGGDDAHAVRVVLLRAEPRVAAHVLDARAADHAIGARREREVVDGRDHPHRNARPLDLLGDRCAATIAGPSRGDEDRAVHLAVSEILGDGPTQLARRRHRRADAGQRVDPLEDAP